MGAARVRVVACGPERARDVHALTQAAFAGYTALDPPSGALRETEERVRVDLAAGCGAIAELDGRPVGCLRWGPAAGGGFHVRRVAVVPELQHAGVGRALMAWAETEAQARGCEVVSVGVRLALPGNLAFYRALGYEPTGEHRHEGYAEPTWLALRKSLSRSVCSARATRHGHAHPARLARGRLGASWPSHTISRSRPRSRSS